ncbi:hypothetical protein GIB67_026046 [Kingdonia uniflora]|uniref:J domain-containing protein n=1 Tax=Kingdonia uniflora TaxID=39325 RepID=A0A7J7M2Y7_9MAGN|nr:hypothetical protein GIB67_026046 [Kingdonia uniflora]
MSKQFLSYIKYQIIMVVSLHYSFNGSKQQLSCVQSLSNSHRRLKANVNISCRATKLAEEKTEKASFYKALSLEPNNNVTVQEIKTAYRRKALENHPDICHPSRRKESTRLFVELNKAYETLGNPVLRKEYDYQLGLVSKFERPTCQGTTDSGLSRERWEDQLYELRRRSDNRMSGRGSSVNRFRCRHE